VESEHNLADYRIGRAEFVRCKNIAPVLAPHAGMIFSFKARAKKTHPRRDYEQRLY
jgi:hypothetical protein